MMRPSLRIGIFTLLFVVNTSVNCAEVLSWNLTTATDVPPNIGHVISDKNGLIPDNILLEKTIVLNDADPFLSQNLIQNVQSTQSTDEIPSKSVQPVNLMFGRPNNRNSTAVPEVMSSIVPVPKQSRLATNRSISTVTAKFRKTVRYGYPPLPVDGPFFPMITPYFAYVREDEPVGSHVISVRAMDSYGPLTYQIIQGNEMGHFRIDPISGFITIGSPLDRELIDGYNLTVRAFDDAGYESTSAVIIRVADTNDNAPVIRDHTLSFEALCGVADLYVGTVHATDYDLGRNGEVYYYLEPDQFNAGMFYIDSTSGELTTAAPLQPGEYTVVVIAKDAGYNSLRSSAMLTIHVACPNDAHVPAYPAPPLHVPPPFPQCDTDRPTVPTVVLYSNAAPLSFVADVSIGNRNGVPVEYRLLSAERIPFLSIDETSGVVHTTSTRSLDVGDTEVNWIATDPLNMVCSGQLLLRVLQASDNQYTAHSIPVPAPPQVPPIVFSQQAYVFMAQCGLGNASLGRLSVQFAGNTGFPTFSLRNNPAGFRVDPRTGELYVLSPLPPLPDSYSLTAEASVLNGAAAANVPVTIRILCPQAAAAPPGSFPYLPPQCPVRPVAGVPLSQFVPPGTRIATAQAVAPDNHGLIYAIVGGDQEERVMKDIFVINTQSGEIVLGQSLSTRIPSEIRVRATDLATGLTCLITIRFPVQTSPPACIQAPVNFTITDSQAAGVPFGSVSNYVRGANLDFRLLHSTAGNVIDVESRSGILTLQASLLVARDRLTGVLPKNIGMTIRITDSMTNDYCDVYLNIFLTFTPPAFANSTYRFSVSCLGEGTLVGGVQAVSLTRELIYDLSGPDATPFMIGRERGDIRSRALLTAPTQQTSFLLNVGVTDTATGMRSQVPAYITAACTPLVCTQMVTVQISEDAPVGTVVGRILPISGFNDPLKTFMYRVASPLMLPLFVNSTSGLVSLAEPLPFGAASTMPRSNFLVVITEQTGQHCNVTVNVVITRRPDNPEFVGTPYYFIQSCYPNSPIVGRVTAVSSGISAYSGTNSITYSISGPESRLFGIDPVSGEIRFAGNTTQSDANRYYQLQVNARTRSGLSATTTVRTEIPLCPIRCPSAVTQAVQEDTSQGTVVIRLLDQIYPNDRQYFFRIISSSPPDAFQTLSMDPMTGTLSVNGSLYGRAGQSFNLQTAVSVRSPSAANGQSCSINVQINVSPRRRSIPGCPSPTAVTVRQDAALGTLVSRINVGDRGDYVYSLIETSGAADFFQIDRVTGSLTVASPLAQLPRKTYSLTIRASVRLDVTRFCDTIVTVNLQSNEQTIRCASASSPIAVNLEASAALGDPVAVVTAASPAGLPVKFTVLENGYGLITVNQTSGIVTLTSMIFSAPPQTYPFTIRASDYTGAFCDTTLRLTIPIMNRPPVFSSLRYDLIADCGPSNSLVGLVNARDPENDPIKFSVTPTEFFTIDQLGGIRSRAGVAGESTYPMLTVSAIDAGGHMTAVPVTVTFRGPQCLVPPRCPQPVYRFTLPAFSTIGYAIGTVTADGNVQPNGQRLPVRYSDFGPDHTFFSVDPATGQIRLATSLVSNSQTAFQIGIRATLVESVNANLFCDITVQIQIPSDSSFPRFSQETYNAEIPCGSAVPSCLGVLEATPGSGSSRSNLAFSAPPDSIVAVDKVTGEVCLRGVLSANHGIALINRAKDGLPVSQRVALYHAFVQSHLDYCAPVWSTASASSLAQILTSAINEGDPAETRVQQVMAQDLDPDDAVTYSIVSGNTNNTFEINQQNGMIVLKRVLDREVASSYRLVAVARDLSGMSCDVIVEVNVIDTNDNVPVFINEPYDWTVPCGQSFPYVGTVSAVDADIGINSRITYSVAPNVPLRVDGYTGEIHSGPGLNTTVHGVYTFVVFASDSGSPQQSASTVIRLTVNCPLFNPFICSASRVLRIPENIPVESTITRILANGNEQANGYLRYGLSGSDKFRILTDGRVITNGMFDRESGAASFFLTVSVVDQIGRECQTNLSIEITDENDQPPRFSQPSYTFTTSCGYTGSLGQVTATDIDLDLNAAVSYTLGTTSSIFTVDYTSGQLRAVSPVHSVPNPINFTVIASDAGVPPQSSSAAVTIFVQCPTQITPTALSMPSFGCPGNVVAEVQENQNGLVISNIVIPGNASGMVYSLVPSTDALMFRLDGGNSGRLIVNTPLDREVQAVYFLTVRISNRLGQNCDVPVRVNVVDVNDNSPVFSQSIYQFSVNCPHGPLRFVVGRVNATDIDSGINAMISYTLQNDMFFAVDVSSGVITLPVHLPAGSSPSRTVIITASNVGTPVRSATAMVHIMLDSNCIQSSQVVSSTLAIPLRMTPPPRCIGLMGPIGPNVLQIPENVTVGTSLGVFEALHEDDRQILLYRLASGDPNNQFFIHPESGALRTEASLDRECRDNYNLTIMVSDSTGQFCSLAVYIQILDVNDNAPEVINMLPVVANVGCNEGNIDIVRLIAFDRDLASNAALSFRLDVQQEFKVSPAGVITLTRPLPPSPTVRFVPVVIYDAGIPSLTTTITVTINVLCPNDAAVGTLPSFEQQYYSVGVRENSPAGSEITRVIARFPDSLANKGYILKSGNSNWFAVDAHTGTITAKNPLDAEGNVSLSDTTLVIGTLNDNRTIPEAYTTVFINILDENDESPVFENHSPVIVPAAVAPNTAVMRVRAQDHDRTYPNNVVAEYHIRNDLSAFFRMEPSGELIVSNSIQSLRGQTLPVVVVAVDGGIPRKTSSVTVALNIV